MDNDVDKIIADAKKVVLTPDERISIRENLLLFMKENTLKRSGERETRFKEKIVPLYLVAAAAAFTRLPWRTCAIVLIIFCATALISVL